MESDPTSFLVFLSIFWFAVYWVLGGVFFAILTILRLGRVRKVRFSCLFSLLCGVVGYGAAYAGIRFSEQAVADCVATAQNKVERITALFGCGFSSVFGFFLIGAAVLTLGGLILLVISRSKTKPWIVIDTVGEEASDNEFEQEQHVDRSSSKFF
jgi:hypothetical protein